MTKKKIICTCPPQRKTCKRPNDTRCRDVEDIIEALNFTNESKPKFKTPPKPPKLITKPFKINDKKTCVPMNPPMATRLRYIAHCPPLPPSTSHPCATSHNQFANYKFASCCVEAPPCKRRVCDRNAKSPCADIQLPNPPPIIRHGASNTSMLNVPSPKVSGENIQAQRATPAPAEWRPPIPPTKGHDLFKPHSGIVINADKSFAPDAVYFPGPSKVPPKPNAHKKGKICGLKNCTRRKCRLHWAKMKKLKKLRKSRCQKRGYRGSKVASDGKPRAKGMSKRFTNDDELCGLDEIQRPEHVRIPPHLKKGMFQTHSLTVLPCTKDRRPDVHYGILTGSFNMYDSKFGGRSRGRQALTMSVMAYCLAFHYHPKQWTMKLIDNLIDAGDAWYIQCADKVHDHSAVQGMCEVLPFGKKQTLLLNSKKMQVLLCEPDVVGYTMSLDPTVYNLCRGLKAFFKDNRAGIMLTRVLKVVIWKDKICYYIFDPAGRDARAYSNFSQGCSALINVKDIDGVAEVLLTRSVVEDQKFVLAPVKVLRMVDEAADEDFESDKELTQAEKAMMGYRILNEYCAIVNANMHLGDRCFEDAKYRQALPISVVTLTYAKISPPNTWHTKTLDKILRLGNKLYVDCANPKVMIDLTIDNIPNEIALGPYACEIIIYRERIKGQLFTTKECLLNIRTGLKEFFSHEYNSGILDFNNYWLAVWRQKDMFYLFDPYPRTNDGLRSVTVGKACCLMLLNTDAMAEAFTKNWDYLPVTTQFYIHGFKVLKLKKREPKAKIVCTLSDEQLPGKKLKRKILEASKARGDATELYHDILPDDTLEMSTTVPQVDEEKMGDIVSLVDSIQEDYLPPIPLRYKKMDAEPLEPRVVNLDSPTVSVTQVVPPWPKPRDKSNELPEPDPDPEPTPPPTPPPYVPPEGGEEEIEEEELDEEALLKKKEDAAKKKAEEEEARRKAEELPPPLPPPPPSPQPEPELAPPPPPIPEEAVEMVEALQDEPQEPFDRHILLAEDAKRRYKLRQIRKKMTQPLVEVDAVLKPEEELAKPHNFKELPDETQIIRGTNAISDNKGLDVLPFAAIMAIVTSYKYNINTWTPGIVTFVVDSANKLHSKKKQKFQLAPMHILPKVAIGNQAFHAAIDVVGEGPTWQLEEVLERSFLKKYDRGMITTTNYSCAFFKKNGLYYLFDGGNCNAMGMREEKAGKACFMRFKSLHEMVCRILYNKDGSKEDQQFILSRIIVRRLMIEPRMKLPEDWDFETAKPKGKKSHMTVVEKGVMKRTTADVAATKSTPEIGYQLLDGVYRIEGTTALPKGKAGKDSKDRIDASHFVCLIAMLQATMHPIRTWDPLMVDICVEKGNEIFGKATNVNPCQKRVIKNVILDGKFININIKKIIVVNENPEKTLEQYMKAVMKRLRYVIVRFAEKSITVCQSGGYYHVFDAYPCPKVTCPLPEEVGLTSDERRIKEKEKSPKGKDKGPKETEKSPKGTEKGSKDSKKKVNVGVASWTLYNTLDCVIKRISMGILEPDMPEFYTFELTSVKSAPRSSALAYKLSPLFKPEENPNSPYLKPRRIRPIVDEKLYWLNIECLPWSRMNPTNDLGLERDSPRTKWKDWDIEFPGDLFSLWGSVHPLDNRFPEAHRGKQYLATSVIACVMTKACDLGGWTGGFLDGIVKMGDKYHESTIKKLGNKTNHELGITDLPTSFDVFPYSFSVKFEKILFGFVYNLLPDRFNLSKALSYFFEKNTLGVLTSPGKNLAFGKMGISYFMFDCQSFGAPVFSPGQGAAYVLKCESLNRLIYCMTLTLNIRRHGQIFHLYSVVPTLSEKAK